MTDAVKAADSRPAPPAPSVRAARRMLAFAWAADRRLTAMAFALVAAEAMASSLTGLWLRLFVDAATGHAAGRAGATMLLAGLAIAVSVTVLAAADFAGSRVRMALQDRTKHQLDRRLLELVGSTPTLTIHQTPAHLAQIEMLQAESWEFGAVVPAILDGATTAARTVITLALLASVSPLLLVLPAFGLPIVALSGHTAGLYSAGNELAAEPSRRAAMLYDLAGNHDAAKELRMLGLSGELQRRFAAEHEQIRRIHARLNGRGVLLRLAGRTPLLAGYLAAIVLVAHEAASGAATIGDVVLTAVLAGPVLALVTGSAEQAQTLLRCLTAAARYLYLEHVAVEAGGGVSRSGPGRGPAPELLTPPARLGDGIRLDSVSFTYPGRASPALDGVTVGLPAGSTVALVGENGAGKTTLVNLLAGLSKPTAGRILIDGTDLTRLDPQAWRKRVSAGFQDHARFELIVQRAVGIGDLPNLDDATAATAALDQAAAADLASDLPAGLGTQLGPRWPGGVDLSGGQWQKLAIGRAMMRTCPLLLLLDEPTAAIDAQAEHELFGRRTRGAGHLREQSGAITVLVSHRFSTVRMADLILVLRDGTICEHGSHAELIALGGLYAELFELQAHAYR